MLAVKVISDLNALWSFGCLRQCSVLKSCVHDQMPNVLTVLWLATSMFSQYVFRIYVAFRLSDYTLFIELKIIETLRAVRDV